MKVRSFGNIGCSETMKLFRNVALLHVKLLCVFERLNPGYSRTTRRLQLRIHRIT